MLIAAPIASSHGPLNALSSMPSRATHQTFSSMLAPALVGVAAALPLAVFLWHFMVDDALISARYAAHLAAGHGYRFNIDGPITDGVTPLGWAYVLAPLCGGEVWAAYRAAKVIGLLAWLVGAAGLGVAIASLGGRRARWTAMLLVAASAPLAAWSVAGMETGLCLGLAAVATTGRALHRERVALAAIGLVAALRPECAPLAIAMALTPPREPTAPPAVGTAPPSSAPSRRWRALAIAMGPFTVVVLIRLVVFGRAAPLSLYAKPSDLTHGLVYAAATRTTAGRAGTARRESGIQSPPATTSASQWVSTTS